MVLEERLYSAREYFCPGIQNTGVSDAAKHGFEGPSDTIALQLHFLC